MPVEFEQASREGFRSAGLLAKRTKSSEKQDSEKQRDGDKGTGRKYPRSKSTVEL
jgi:hypothetical protein